MEIKNGQLIMYDISEEYKDYFNNEIAYLRKENVIQELLKKAENIFSVLDNPNHIDYKFFKSLCCDFNLLEQKCIDYNKKTCDN